MAEKHATKTGGTINLVVPLVLCLAVYGVGHPDLAPYRPDTVERIAGPFHTDMNILARMMLVSAVDSANRLAFTSSISGQLGSMVR